MFQLCQAFLIQCFIAVVHFFFPLCYSKWQDSDIFPFIISIALIGERRISHILREFKSPSNKELESLVV